MKERLDAAVGASGHLKTIANKDHSALGIGNFEAKKPQEMPSGLRRRHPSDFPGQAGEGITAGKGQP